MCRFAAFMLFTSILAVAATSCGDDDKPVRSDTTPPEVTLLSPEDGWEAPPPRSISFQARATDNTGVTRVDFLFNGELVGSDSVGAAGDSSAVADLYDYQWQTPLIPAGNHQAKARAVDAVGNASEDAATVHITAGTRPGHGR